MELQAKNITVKRKNTYLKVAVKWLYEILYFVSNSILADSFVLLNRQLLVTANR